MEEVLVISLHAVNGRVDDFDGGSALLADTFGNALDGLFASLGVADDPAFRDVFAADFELGLDEDDSFALPELLRRAESGEDRWQDESGGDERDIHGEEGWCGLAGREEFAGSEEAGVG